MHTRLLLLSFLLLLLFLVFVLAKITAVVLDKTWFLQRWQISTFYYAFFSFFSLSSKKSF